LLTQVDRSPTGKTPEELALENENLRISLDAIASLAQAVDAENKRLRAEAEERSKMMKSAILEVKKEVCHPSFPLSVRVADARRRRKQNMDKI
jgi:hypothetical protein